VSFCFPINGNNKNPECKGIDEIMYQYDNVLNDVQLYGPTNFTPSINMAMNFCKHSIDTKEYKYYVIYF
jgi:hypothetical protein